MFETCSIVLKNGDDTRLLFEIFSNDYSMNGLFVYENHIRGIQNMCHVNESCVLLSETCEINKHMCNNWDLISSVIMMYVRTGMMQKRNFSFPNFPSIMSKMASLKKKKILVHNISNKIKSSCTNTRLVYIPLISSIMETKMVNGDTDECIKFLKENKLTRDDLFEVFPLFFNFEKVQTKVKSLITRKFNKENKPKKKSKIIR